MDSIYMSDLKVQFFKKSLFMWDVHVKSAIRTVPRKIASTEPKTTFLSTFIILPRVSYQQHPIYHIFYGPSSCEDNLHSEPLP